MLEHGRHVSSSLLCRRFLLCSCKSAPEEDASGVEEQQVGVRITDELRNITRAGLLPGMVMRDALMMTLKPPKSLRCGKAKTEMTTSRMKANPKSADLLPNLPSFISRVRSVFGPCWGGLQIRSA
jgi:hypothetical protein